VIVVVERTAGFDACARHFNSLRVGEVNVGPAIAIVVDERHASTHRLDNEFLLGAGVMIELNSCGGCDVDQFWIVGSGRFSLRKRGQRSRDAQTKQQEHKKSSGQPPEIAVPARSSSICLRANHPAGRLRLRFQAMVRMRLQDRGTSAAATRRRSTTSAVSCGGMQSAETIKRFPELTANLRRIRLVCRHQERKPGC
jgi:hypothetical protein